MKRFLIYYMILWDGFVVLVRGILKGFDGLMNLVLDESKESFRNDHQNEEESEESVKMRDLGLVVVRGPQIVVISPTDGAEEIANPFLQTE
jgi:U6 snRNA-associated Sm-like protein LSm7